MNKLSESKTTGVTTSVFVTFENRFFLLFGERTFWIHLRKYAIVASYVIVPLYYLPVQFVLPDQEIGREFSWTVCIIKYIDLVVFKISILLIKVFF